MSLELSAQPRAAVIGAGVAGASCANALAAAGWDVTVYDKSRGPGGRASTRRRGEVVVDHGAQYFTVRTPRFRAIVDRWIANGVAQRWHVPVVTVGRGGVAGSAAVKERFVGVPGMSALSSDLLRRVILARQSRVHTLRRDPGGWTLKCEGRSDSGPFDCLFLAIPAPQAAALADGLTALVDQIRRVEMSPCWAVVAAFDRRIGTPWEAAHVSHAPLAWVARNASKPERPRLPDVWVLHASVEWSEEHLENEPTSVAGRLLDEFARLAPLADASVSYLEAHRWRFARPARPASPDTLWDAVGRIGFCGDWMGHARIESAVLSGMELARAATESLTHAPGGRHGT